MTRMLSYYDLSSKDKKKVNLNMCFGILPKYDKIYLRWYEILVRKAKIKHDL